MAIEMARTETPSSELTIQHLLAWPQQGGEAHGEAARLPYCGQCGIQVRGKFCGHCGAAVRAAGKTTVPQLGGPLIQVDRVRQEYDDVLAVDGISFTVGEGESFGFLGDAGAGKSTILRLLAGRLTPTSGSVRIMGRDAAAAAEQGGAPVSLVLDENTLCAQLSGRITLLAFARLYGVSPTRVSDMLDLAGLDDVADRLVSRYSPGMRRRLMVARALLSAPRVLCADEPTRDLDLEAAGEVCAVLGRLNAAGIALVLTMRDLDEAGQLCHEVALLRAGRMTALDRPRNLRLRSAS